MVSCGAKASIVPLHAFVRSPHRIVERRQTTEALEVYEKLCPHRPLRARSGHPPTVWVVIEA